MTVLKIIAVIAFLVFGALLLIFCALVHTARRLLGDEEEGS